MFSSCHTIETLHIAFVVFAVVVVVAFSALT